MNESTLTAPVFRPAATGRTTWAMGSLFETLLSASDSGGELGVSVVTQPPGIATPLHLHANESEAIYLLAGTMTYRAGDEVHRLAEGDFVFLPKGVPHAFRITGRTPAKVVALTVPGGLLSLYDEVGVPATERRLPGEDGLSMAEEIQRWNEIGPRYGLTVVGPPIPDDEPAS
ncbi:cupin domain-containing protein [Angustibacter sp. McL0619]|uniref:cupin domain-containing protein n=1 Tax=Angustibacter sp. McL0619 TaxID=3415676 RepID=UPI003CED9C25